MPLRWPQKRLGRRLEEGTKAVGSGCCRLQMPLKSALAVRETVAGHRLGALEGGGGYLPPLSNASLPAGAVKHVEAAAALLRTTSYLFFGGGGINAE